MLDIFEVGSFSLELPNKLVSFLKQIYYRHLGSFSFLKKITFSFLKYPEK